MRERVLGMICVIVAAVAVGPRVADAADVCARACRTLEKNCAGFARAALKAAKPACADRACRKAAQKTHKASLKECRDARKACRPCCKLGSPNACAQKTGVRLEAEAQASGDAALGRDLLLGGDFMTCGVPYKIWKLTPGIIAGSYGGGADAPRIPDRPGENADLPYFLNVFDAPDNGARVVTANCLMCHGGQFDGTLHIGLGNATADFTAGAGGAATGIDLTEEFMDALDLDEPERAQLRKIGGRGGVLGPQTKMRTVGMNPAEMFAVILMVHHDRDTLAWSDEPLASVVPRDHAGAPIADPKLTSDPPPWWRVHKKNALFYNGMARGDHRGTMALATSVCVDDVPRAQVVDDQFRHIQAYVASLRAPAYPRTIDPALAAEGKPLFERDCAICHGTYADTDENETYPNLLFPLDAIGTDPAVAEAGTVHSPELVDWYNGSFYGQVTRMVPNDPFAGYMAPPLDGIWATAPFFHNGSVPTVELVLNSRARPAYWRRVDQDSRNFDENALGWPWVASDVPQAEAPEAERKFIYDTSYWSQSNAGHPFGDHFTAAERRAVIEYLKTF